MKYPARRRVSRFLFAAAAFAGAAVAGSGDLAAQTTPGPKPSICSRSCWNARSGSTSEMSAINRAVIHHTAGTSDYNTTSLNASKSKVRAIQNYHMDSNGWSDIGYHFVVDKLGNTFEARVRSANTSYRPRGVHDKVNSNSIAVCVMGYYHPPYNQTFTTAGKNAVWDVIAWRLPSGWSPYGSSSYGGSTVGRVAGHRNVPTNSTACPGDGIYSTIGTNFSGGEARNGIAARRDGSPPPSSTPPSGIFWYGPGNDPDTLWLGRTDPVSGTNGHFIGSQPVEVSSEYIPVVGDFNGNGKTDILWYGPGSDSDTMWLGKTDPDSWTNGRFTTQQSVSVSGTYIPIAGDFDGDGRADIFWYGPGSDGDTLWRGRASDKGGANGWFDGQVEVDVNGTYTPVVGDFNGDGRADIFWYSPGNCALWFGRATSSGGSNPWFNTGSVVNVSGTYTPVAGDFDGDGRTDIFWYAPGSASDTLWRGRSSDKGGTNGWFDGQIDVDIDGTYTPIVGNFNGTSGDDIFWYGSGSDPDRLWLGRANPQSGTNGAFQTLSEDTVDVNGVYVPIAGKW